MWCHLSHHRLLHSHYDCIRCIGCTHCCEDLTVGCCQCAELNWQLRGEAGPRQVTGARVGLQHNLGLGGACVVTMYKRPEEWLQIAPKRKVSGAMGFDGEQIQAKL